MSTPRHHYTFEVSRPAPATVASGETQRFHSGAAGTSPAEAEKYVRRQYPTATVLTLAHVEPWGERCGDDRCAVCYPSSRNRGTL